MEPSFLCRFRFFFILLCGCHILATVPQLILYPVSPCIQIQCRQLTIVTKLWATTLKYSETHVHYRHTIKTYHIRVFYKRREHVFEVSSGLRFRLNIISKMYSRKSLVDNLSLSRILIYTSFSIRYVMLPHVYK